MQNILPVQLIDSPSSILKTDQTLQQTALPFQSVFEDAVNNVIETQQEADAQALLISTGQSDDLHTLSIASTKASLSLELLVQLRNEALDAYNNLMQMNI
jgi:flagellar hook-basal body complex protein FliE